MLVELCCFDFALIMTPLCSKRMDWPDVLRLKQRRTFWLNKISPLYIHQVFADWNVVELYDWTWPLLNGLSQALKSMGNECEPLSNRGLCSEN